MKTWTQESALGFKQRLRAELHAMGVFRGDTAGYWCRGIWVTALAISSWACLVFADSLLPYLAAVIAAAYVGVQASAIAHEAGHGAVTRASTWRWRIGRFFMTFLMGASYSAWVKRHSAHHHNPNSREDPDVRPGMFSFNAADAAAARGLAGWCTRHQHLLLLPLSSLMSFSLKFTGWRHVLCRPGAELLDLVLLLAHLATWIVLPAVWVGWGHALLNFFLVTWIQGIYLAFVFLPNHLGNKTAEEASTWPPALRQVITTRNLPGSWILSHICMGLNTHIEHHLFGTLPATRLLEAREITRRHCREHGVPYLERGVGSAVAELQRYNRCMADIARHSHQLRQRGCPA
jgi:fatty acid desaturase